MDMLRAHMTVLAVAVITVAFPAFAKKPAPPPAESAGPVFDRGAASRELSQVSVLPCKQSKGPSGDGHIVVTFAPTGEVQDAVVDREPFKGTAVGRCIAGQFKRAHVPKFSGAPVTVGKTFHID
jgi:hypothetical protein